jgi:hypothetical protein
MKRAPARGSPWLIGMMAALALGACGKADNHVKADPGQSSPPQASSSSIPPAPPALQIAQKDSHAADTNASETAKGTDEPMKSMSKDEETKAMPRSGQANDHSTLAQDPKQPKEEK